MRSGALRRPESADSSPGTRLPGLRRRVVTLLLVASLIPLTVLGAGAWIVFGRIFSAKIRENLGTIVLDHAAAVDLFLEERLAALTMVAGLHHLEEIGDREALAEVLAALDSAYGHSFADLGVIDESGTHVAYVGPHDLAGRNYRESPWFARVVRDGHYISDVFLGFRNAPHFIMAVRRVEASGRCWILRATVDSEVFERLVRQGRRGRTGDCFIVDREGRYQTRPLGGGPPLGPSDVPLDPRPLDLQSTTARSGNGDVLVRTLKPIKSGDWILVAQQERGELNAPLRRASEAGLLVFGAGVAVIAVVSFLSTGHLVARIAKAVRRAEESNVRFLQAGKLASIGEMATGLAHEINNPLAIIASEQTNIGDLLSEAPEADSLAEMRDSLERTKRQIGRCKTITSKMLQFGRQGTSAGEVVRPAGHLREIVRMLAPQAAVSDVDVCLEIEGEPSPVLLDAGEFQQVVTNLVNNARQAMPRGGHILISLWEEEGPVHLTVEDTGPGIPEDLRERVFEPFFTTKPVNVGTGLGLSVCYGIAAKWRGTILVEGPPEGGALFHVQLPSAERGEGEGPREG